MMKFKPFWLSVCLLACIPAMGQTVLPVTGMTVPALNAPGFAPLINGDLNILEQLLSGVVRYPTGVFYQGSNPSSCSTETYLIVSTATPITPTVWACGSGTWRQIGGNSSPGGTGWTIGPNSGLPGTCTTGAAYFATDLPAGQQLYLCSATNTYIQFMALGGSGGIKMVAGLLDTDSSVIGFLANANSWLAVQQMNAGLNMLTSTSQPSCDINHRGWYWYVNGGSSADSAQACEWNGSAYAWTSFGGSSGVAGDYYQPFVIPAANQNGGLGGNAWSIPSTNGCTIPAGGRTGTNIVSGTLTITASTSCQFRFYLPQGWDTAVLPYVRINLISQDTTSGHTIIPSVGIYCSNGGGTNTDDGAFNTTQALSTVTLNGTAFREWTTSRVQLNSTSMTGAIAGSYCNAKVTASGTATDMQIESAVVTIPVKISAAGAQ